MDTTFFFRLLFFVLVMFSGSLHGSRFHTISVGVVSSPEDDSRQNSRKFWSFNSSTNVILEPIVEDIRWWGSLQLTRAVCSLLKTGVHAFVSATPPRLYPLMKSYSSRFHLPLISSSAPTAQLKGDVALLPNPALAIADLLKNYEWTSFVYFYDNDDGPALLEEIMVATGYRIYVEAFWRVTSGEEVHRFLQLLPSGQTSLKRILLATKEQLLDEIITTIPSSNHHFILADQATSIKEDVRSGLRGSYMITKLSVIVDHANHAYRDLENRWHTLLSHLRRSGNSKTVPNSALIARDMASILEKGFAHLVEELPTFNITSPGLNCLDDEAANNPDYLNAVRKHIKKVVLESGMSGRIQFSPSGERTGFTFNIAEITPSAVKKIGTWSSKSRLMISEDSTKEALLDDGDRENEIKPPTRRIVITSLLENTLLELKMGENKTKNDRFKGFIKDLIATLSQSLGWDYELRLANDGSIGKRLSDGQWTGMIGEVIRQEADLAVGPIEIKSDRSLEVDFSKPILTAGLTILLKKPVNSQYSFVGIGPMGFLQVWSYKVWMLLALAYVVISCATYAVSHFTGEPERIRSLDTKLSDRLSPCSSFWFVLGSLVFRGTGIYPRSVSHRLLSLVWWVFTLMIFIFYVSTLTSLLLKDRTKSDTIAYPKKSDEFLKNFLDHGYPKVGIWSKETYFKYAEVGLHREYGNAVDNDISLLVDSYEKGVERVRNSDGGFALIVDSVFGHYVSGREPCDTMVTSGFLTHAPYAIVFKKGSQLRESVDHVLLELMSSGELRRIYEKWWYHNSTCINPHFNVLPNIYSSSLTLNEVSGVFYFLMASMCIAAIAAAAEYFVQTKRLSVDN